MLRCTKTKTILPVRKGGEAEHGLAWWKIFRLFCIAIPHFGPALRVSLSLIPSTPFLAIQHV